MKSVANVLFVSQYVIESEIVFHAHRHPCNIFARPPISLYFKIVFLFLFLTGVNSFLVYMAYKDLYQMSNAEVKIRVNSALLYSAFN